MTATRPMVISDPMILPRGVRSVVSGLGRRNEDSRAASLGSVATSRRSISASMRCSSIDSAIAPYRRVPRSGWNYLTISHGGVFIQSFCDRSRPFLEHTNPDYLQCSHENHKVVVTPAASSDPNRCLPYSNSRSRLVRMRWDHLLLDSTADADHGRLPMFARGAVVRTFDTPGFRGMTFYEIQAKSIVSRVPEASRMPFRWTINPYRGCQHSCVYCVTGETPVLMADGAARPIADVRVGDAIYGTVRDGFYRRYAVTEVLAHWSTVKPAYRVTLEDGMQLVTSGDHRFLTERGWKHVTGAEQGPEQRPFLTTNNKLMGFGRFAEPPKESSEYRRGYLCGMVRGDGTLGSYSYGSHAFRLALVDSEALARTRHFLGTFGILTHEFDF